MSLADGRYCVFCVVDLDVPMEAPGHVVFVGYTEHWKRRVAEIRRGYRCNPEIAVWLKEKGARAEFQTIGMDMDGDAARLMALKAAAALEARFNRPIPQADLNNTPVLRAFVLDAVARRQASGERKMVPEDSVPGTWPKDRYRLRNVADRESDPS